MRLSLLALRRGEATFYFLEILPGERVFGIEQYSPFKVLPSSGEFASLGKSGAPIRLRHGIRGVEARGNFKFVDGFTKTAQGGKRISQIVMRGEIVGFGERGCFERMKSLARVSHGEQRATKSIVGHGILGTQPDRLPIVKQCLRDFAAGLKHSSQVVLRRKIGRISQNVVARERLFERPAGFFLLLRGSAREYLQP